MNRFAPSYTWKFRPWLGGLLQRIDIQKDGKTVHTVWGVHDYHTIGKAIKWGQKHGDPRFVPERYR